MKPKVHRHNLVGEGVSLELVSPFLFQKQKNKNKTARFGIWWLW